MTSAELLREGVEAARAGRKAEAREMLLRVVDMDPHNEMAWMWLTGLVDTLEDKIIACENVLAINPANEKVRFYLENLLKQKAPLEPIKADKASPVKSPTQKSVQKKEKSPDLSVAEQWEHEGKIAEALRTYELLASKTKDSATFDYIYRQITRLEGLQREKIRHIPPSLSIWRLTSTWTLLYLSFVFVQVGLNPIAHPSWLWLGFPFVIVGSFLLALSEIRIRHMVLEQVFLEDGSGSSFARIVLAVTGWVFVIIPFALILLNSLVRLQNFQIPPEPFLR